MRNHKGFHLILPLLFLVTGIFCVFFLVLVLEKRNTVENDRVSASEIQPEEVPAIISLSQLSLSESGMSANTVEKQKKMGERISIQASTISKELKIKLLSQDGKRKKGIPFSVTLENEASQGQVYEDEDQDGMIIIPDLNTGTYQISLQPQPGFLIPEGKTTVRVKNQITYTALADILTEIKLESEIDVSKEDTANIEETDEGVSHAIGQVGTYGIDVSKWNGNIDWGAVKEAGVEYAIIRLGYRGSQSGAMVEDPYFLQNFQGAGENNIKRGVYFFSQAMNEAEAVEEASMVVALLQKEPLQYPVFLDVEGSGGRADTLDPVTRTTVINAFIQTIQNEGYEAGVYANKNWFTHKIDTENMNDCIKWLAQYNVTEPDYDGNYHMWQYSSKASVNGIAGYVDVNQSYLDR